MRKFTLCLATCLLAGATFAQKGLEIGLNFTPAATMILNSEDFAEDQDLDFRGAFGYNAGLTLGYNFTDGLGITSGIIISKQGCNYITGYDGVAKADQGISSRQLNYVRVPVLFKVNGSLDGAGTSFFRIGPVFDFLTSAKYTYDTRTLPLAHALTHASGSVDMRNIKNASGDKYALYNTVNIGAMLEAGGMVNISESMKLVFALQLVGTFNTEGKDAGKFNGFNFYTSSLVNSPFIPADASSKRSSAFNVSAGITVGFNYVLSFD